MHYLKSKHILRDSVSEKPETRDKYDSDNSEPQNIFGRNITFHLADLVIKLFQFLVDLC